MMRYIAAFLCSLVLAIAARTQPPDPTPAQWAVVRIRSHGASATVIATGQGKSLLLGCGHAYEGANRAKPMNIDVPTANPGTDKRATMKLLAVDYASDLSLIELGDGPLAKAYPVAPAGHRPARLLSAGYDEMKWPATVRTATICGSNGGNVTYTFEKPWHGRSGGGLIDVDNGFLIGVVSGYEVTGQQRGVYVSHAAILSFLQRNGYTVPGALDRAPRQPIPQPFVLPGGQLCPS